MFTVKYKKERKQSQKAIGFIHLLHAIGVLSQSEAERLLGVENGIPKKLL
jgi:hypothetical protein